MKRKRLPINVAAISAVMAAAILWLAVQNSQVSADDAAPSLDAATLPAAVAALREQYPLEDVDLYLHTLRLQDHATWGGLGEFL